MRHLILKHPSIYSWAMLFSTRILTLDRTIVSSSAFLVRWKSMCQPAVFWQVFFKYSAYTQDKHIYPKIWWGFYSTDDKNNTRDWICDYKNLYVHHLPPCEHHTVVHVHESSLFFAEFLYSLWEGYKRDKW